MRKTIGVCEIIAYVNDDLLLLEKNKPRREKAPGLFASPTTPNPIIRE
jgi:hypothetical protein